MRTFITSVSFFLASICWFAFLENRHRGKTFKHGGVEPKLTRINRTDVFADPDAVVVLTFIPLCVSPRISIRLSLRGTPRRLPPPSYDHDDDVLVISQMPLMEHKGASDSERRLILKMVCVAAGSSRLSSLGAQPCIAPY